MIASAPMTAPAPPNAGASSSPRGLVPLLATLALAAACAVPVGRGLLYGVNVHSEAALVFVGALLGLYFLLALWCAAAVRRALVPRDSPWAAPAWAVACFFVALAAALGPLHAAPVAILVAVGLAELVRRRLGAAMRRALFLATALALYGAMAWSDIADAAFYRTSLTPHSVEVFRDGLAATLHVPRAYLVDETFRRTGAFAADRARLLMEEDTLEIEAAWPSLEAWRRAAAAGRAGDPRDRIVIRLVRVRDGRFPAAREAKDREREFFLRAGRGLVERPSPIPGLRMFQPDEASPPYALFVPADGAWRFHYDCRFDGDCEKRRIEPDPRVAARLVSFSYRQLAQWQALEDRVAALLDEFQRAR